MGLGNSQQYHNDFRPLAWLMPAIFVAASLLVMLFGESGREWLRYDRVWLGQGEYWRLVSGHFAHLSWSHFALNSAGVLLVWFLVGRNYALDAWLLIVAATVFTMDIAFWTLNPELHWYVGMSGMLHGVLVAGILSTFPKLDLESVVLAVLIVAKLLWEQLSGPVPGSEFTSGGPVVVDAHLYGAAGGAIGALMARIRVRARTPI